MASAVIWVMLIGVQVLAQVLIVRGAADLNGNIPPWVVGYLLSMAMLMAVLAGCSLYYLCGAIRPPMMRFGARGVVARQPWRGAFYIPWDAVVQIGVYRGMRVQLVVEVSDDFWQYLGRRWTPRWAAWAGPPRGANMIMVPPRGTGMEMSEILQCLRRLAPPTTPVTNGLLAPG